MTLEMTPEERRLRSQIGAHRSWANTEDRSARTAPARRAMDQKFLDQAGGDPVRAAHLRKAFYAEMALKSARARRAASLLRRSVPTGLSDAA